MSGERGDVSAKVVEDWKEKLPTVCAGYEPRYIFNMDETGLFYKAGRRTTYTKSGTECSGGKRAKDRITVALCASMMGEKMKPLVIGKAKNPRCFSKLKKGDSLPVTYVNNKKSWMTSKLFQEWISEVDRRMRRQKRNILLFIDNAPTHPDVNLRNVKVVFLPKNTTSVIQPMDQGIIQAMKLKFYIYQSQHVIAKMEKSSLSGSELLKEINVLDTMYWIKKAWNEVDDSTKVKCFDKSGFDKVRSSHGAETENDEEEDEDDDVPLSMLAKSESIYGCSMHKLTNENIPVCDTEEINWDRPASELIENDSGSDSEPEVEEVIKTFQVCSFGDGGDYLSKLKDFACDRGNVKLLNCVMDMSAVLTEMSMGRMTVQPTIQNFFKTV